MFRVRSCGTIALAVLLGCEDQARVHVSLPSSSEPLRVRVSGVRDTTGPAEGATIVALHPCPKGGTMKAALWRIERNADRATDNTVPLEFTYGQVPSPEWKQTGGDRLTAGCYAVVVGGRGGLQGYREFELRPDGDVVER
jgi:hypothetical protein